MSRPERTQSVLRVAALGLVVIAALLIALINAGTFDPKPSGSLLRTDRPGLSSATDEGSAFPQLPPWPPSNTPGRFSVRLTAAHVDGETDIEYGLALGDGSRRLIVAVSPLGYVAVREDADTGEPIYHRPWQPWPHVRRGAEPNEVWLDVVGVNGRARIEAWVNRELLWQGEVDQPAGKVSLWLGSSGGPATVEFHELEWFAETGG